NEEELITVLRICALYLVELLVLTNLQVNSKQYMLQQRIKQWQRQHPAHNWAYMHAAHTAIPNNRDVADDEKDESLAADAANEQCEEDQVEEQPEESSDKYVELAVYKNDFYTSGDDQDHLFALTECPSSLEQGDVPMNQVQMRKVKVLTLKEALK
ncbi:hypothetical protein DXG01_004832, partial [Tephrocybe rancida]